MKKKNLTNDEVIKRLKEKQNYLFDGNEKKFKEFVVENINEIFENANIPKTKKIEIEKVIKLADIRCRIDLFIIHTDNTVSIMETKCTNNKFPSTASFEQCKAIGQILLYGYIFECYYGVKPRLFLIDTKIHFRTFSVINKYKLPIILMEIQNDGVFILKL